MTEDKGQVAANLWQSTWWDLKAWTKGMLDFQKNAIQQHKETKNSERDAWLEKVFTSGLNATDHWVAQECNSYYRLGQVAKWIRDYFAKEENWGYDYSGIDDEPLFDDYCDANPDRKDELYAYVLDWGEYCDPTELYTNMGWIIPDEEEMIGEISMDEEKNSSTLANVAQSIIDVPLNLGKLPFNLIDKGTAWVAKQFSDDDEAIDQKLQENLQNTEDFATLPNVDRESYSYQIPNLVTDLWVTVATSFIPWVWEEKRAEWAVKYPKLAKLIKASGSVEKFLEKNPKLAKWIEPFTKWGKIWVKDTAVMNALEWEWTTPLEAIEWWLAGWVVEKGLNSLKWLATFLETNGLFTPSKARNIISKLKDIWAKAPWKWNVDDLADFMTQHWLTWSKKQIVDKAVQLWKDKKVILDELLSQSKSVHSLEAADEALEKLRDRLINWLPDAPMLPREQDLVEISELLWKSGNYTLSDLEKVKMKIDDLLKLYNKNWTPADNDTARLWRETRKEIQTYIEDVAKEEWLWEVAMLNNEIQTAYAIADGIENKTFSDAVNSAIWKYGVYWAASVPVLKDIYEGNYEWALKSWWFAFLFWNTWLRTHLWSMLNRMSGTTRYEVEKWIADEGRTALSENASAELNSILQKDNAFKEFAKQYITSYIKEWAIVWGQKWIEEVADVVK